MLIVDGWIRFADGEIERLADVARTMVAETHKEPGCLDYAFARDLTDPNVMRISERWVDAAALAAHVASAHMAAFQTALAGARREGGSIKSYTAEFQRTLVGD